MMIDLFADPALAWQEDGACVSAGLDPRVFLSRDRCDVAAAIAVCATCPVILECRRFAVAGGQTCGVWGGVDFGAAP